MATHLILAGASAETMMSSYATSAAWNSGLESRRHGPFRRRGWEIAAIILGFVFAWPLALAYLAWTFTGYPLPRSARAFAETNFGWSFAATERAAARVFGTGNFAFEEYRRGELDRLEAERRRLDEESRAFSEFVDDLKRAKDREEFDAFMAKRRSGGQAS
jgi:hypothetical protein